jgi:type IV pilus assembly protein PilW
VQLPYRYTANQIDQNDDIDEVLMLMQRSNNSRQQGFSMIELMIAMTLGILLLSGVIQIFLSSKQAYGTVSGASETLDNGRLSMHFLSTALGKAGYWGDVTKQRVYASDTTLTMNHSGTSNAPYANSYNGVFTAGAYIFGEDNDSTDANVVNGTDQLWLRYNGHDTLPVFNCAGQAVNADQIAYERYYVSEPNGNELVSSLVCETSIMNFNENTGDTTAPGTPAITTVPLISGVENMQLLFAQGNINYTQSQLLKASDVTDWDRVVSVRVAALASSATEVNSATRSSGYSLLDTTTGTPTDRRARRVFEQTIALRNSNN